MHAVIKYQAIRVVNNLDFETELNRFTKPPFADRPGVGIMQRHQPGRASRRRTINTHASLTDNPPGALQQSLEVSQQAPPPPTWLGAVLQRPRLGDREDRQVRQLAGNRQDLGFGLLRASS